MAIKQGLCVIFIHVKPFKIRKSTPKTRRKTCNTMAKFKLTLDKRADHTTKDGKFPLVLRIAHKSKTRDIGFDIHLRDDQFDEVTGRITGIQNSVRNTKRVQKIYGDVDLWLDENKASIKLWEIAMLKDQTERRFFKKQSELNILEHSAKVLYRFASEGKYSTASTYEDALKAFVKYRIKKAHKDDLVMIKTLFDQKAKETWTVLEDFCKYDMPIKAINAEFAKDFKAYMSNRGNSVNTVRIHLRSLQSILSDAEKSYDELKGHKPFEGIKKTSVPNAPIVLTMEEISSIRDLSSEFEKGSSQFHVCNYFFFMFNNMGMNFIDLALAKVAQFDGERFNYTRKKTEEEGDNFSIKQNEENLKILHYYSKGKEKDQYLFPIVPEGTPEHRVFRVKKDKAHWFNKHMKQIAAQLGIEKNVTTYAARDTWTNIGLGMGIDIRKISSGLGHSSVHVTEKHYSQRIQEKILDEINDQITSPELRQVS